MSAGALLVTPLPGVQFRCWLTPPWVSLGWDWARGPKKLKHQMYPKNCQKKYFLTKNCLCKPKSDPILSILAHFLHTQSQKSSTVQQLKIVDGGLGLEKGYWLAGPPWGGGCPQLKRPGRDHLRKYRIASVAASGTLTKVTEGIYGPP